VAVPFTITAVERSPYVDFEHRVDGTSHIDIEAGTS
jgi:hypothetical protein